MIKVFIVDDHPVVVEGISHLLAHYPDMQVTASACSAAEAFEMITSQQPDIVLMDIRLTGADGISLCERLQRVEFKGRVIILTSYDDSEYLLRAARAGVYGYLLKSASAEDLAETIRAVYSGERRISPALGGQAMEQLVALSQTQPKFDAGFDDDEIQLLGMMASGINTRQMAEKLHLSERTVKRRIQNILTALDAATRAQAVATAFERGLL